MYANPLGQTTDFPDEYAPDVLFAIPRSKGRSALGIESHLPFDGVDIWNAWELTWLDDSGKPVAGTVRMHVNADSPNIVESKSLKLYLGSFAMTQYESAIDVMKIIDKDVADVVDCSIDVAISTGLRERARTIQDVSGENIDQETMTRVARDVDPGLLSAAGETVSETLNTHLLRSLCPVTGQPDFGSLMIQYRGPQIDRSSLLDYVVSFRRHQDFHESCVERIFLDVKARCRPEALTVYACYTRRGGIDINPFRTDTNVTPPSGRFWRQ